MAKITASASSESIPSQTAAVDAFMKKTDHPLKAVAQLAREVMLGADKNIGEEIAWNAPAFYYTGSIKPFPPKEYRRFIVGINFYKKDCLRLVFLHGALANDKSGLLQGDYADGRRLAFFKSIAEVNARKKDLQQIIKVLLKQIDN